ncbi:MAG TPA: hypothetical protein VGL29_06320, partial [Blastocatellia bacterium]
MNTIAPRAFFQPSQPGALRGLPGICGPACFVFEPPDVLSSNAFAESVERTNATARRIHKVV